jgi:hypothetical protein
MIDQKTKRQIKRTVSAWVFLVAAPFVAYYYGLNNYYPSKLPFIGVAFLGGIAIYFQGSGKPQKIFGNRRGISSETSS